MDLLAVGVVKATHGVKGEFRIKSYSGSLETLLSLPEAVLRKGTAEKRFRVESRRAVARDMLMKVEGVDSLEEARRLVGYEVWASRRFAAPLVEGEYYEADLCLCSVFYGEELIGPVKSVWDAGAGQLLAVEGVDGRTVLVPFIDRYVGEVDVENHRISLRRDDIIR